MTIARLQVTRQRRANSQCVRTQQLDALVFLGVEMAAVGGAVGPIVHHDADAHASGDRQKLRKHLEVEVVLADGHDCAVEVP